MKRSISNLGSQVGLVKPLFRAEAWLASPRTGLIIADWPDRPLNDSLNGGDRLLRTVISCNIAHLASAKRDVTYSNHLPQLLVHPDLVWSGRTPSGAPWSHGCLIPFFPPKRDYANKRLLLFTLKSPYVWWQGWSYLYVCHCTAQARTSTTNTLTQNTYCTKTTTRQSHTHAKHKHT